ncbi:agamous-like MADS-box protein AGL3 [Cucumis melo var. makuwa]|uniref:Agamous-like MADS-box protein AGL3 n=1 Tax=Cucumis melo var. makuwa TaxID=1194695 RepID=A0A5A7U2J6_CUCMM|nr:agamous-like MADS-box protein AGL3 [Cucumis melo var. makuwa]TYK28279.1 agamous-like MADS-box protein AGL3 [Cucumis melo var. makuwa]
MIEFMEADYDDLIDQAVGMDTPPFQTEDEETTQFKIFNFLNEPDEFEDEETIEFNISDFLNDPNEFEEYDVEGFQSLLQDEFLETLVQNNPILNIDFDY